MYTGNDTWEEFELVYFNVRFACEIEVVFDASR